MTREEAFAKITVCSNSLFMTKQKFKILIHTLYNDFESRVCENCKYFNEVSSCEHEKNTQYLMTSTQFTEQAYYQMGVTKDFGCNRFERK